MSPPLAGTCRTSSAEGAGRQAPASGRLCTQTSHVSLDMNRTGTKVQHWERGVPRTDSWKQAEGRQSSFGEQKPGRILRTVGADRQGCLPGEAGAGTPSPLDPGTGHRHHPWGLGSGTRMLNLEADVLTSKDAVDLLPSVRSVSKKDIFFLKTFFFHSFIYSAVINVVELV